MLSCFASTVHNAHLICVISDLLKQRCNHELGLQLAVLTKTHNLFLYLLVLKNVIAFLHLHGFYTVFCLTLLIHVKSA